MVNLYVSDQKNVLLDSNNNTYTTFDNIRGVNEKFWIKNNIEGTEYLFKLPSRRKSEIKSNVTNIGEVICCEICAALDISHAQYFACNIQIDEKNSLIGVLSKNYKSSSKDQEVTGKTLYEYWQNYTYDNNNGFVPKVEYNTVYSLLDHLKFYFNDKIDDNKLLTIKDDLLTLALFDFCTCQTDRHWENVGWLFNESEPDCAIRTMPIYDNQNSFFLNKNLNKLIELSNILAKSRTPYNTIKDTLYAKHNLPRLGIKTTMVEMEDVFKILIPKEEKEKGDNLAIFVSELANEIKENKKLKNIFKNIVELDIENILKNQSDIPSEIIPLVVNIWKGRVNTIVTELSKDPDFSFEEEIEHEFQ